MSWRSAGTYRLVGFGATRDGGRWTRFLAFGSGGTSDFAGVLRNLSDGWRLTRDRVGKTNAKLRSASAITVSLEAPRPLLDEGEYLATCTDATVAWSRRWKKWIARLVMEPSDYQGIPYTGTLCKFFQLGSNPRRPHAGQQSEFRKLLVRLNGAQPVNGEASLALFVGRSFQIQVCTVRERSGEKFLPTDWYSVVREISPTPAAGHQRAPMSEFPQWTHAAHEYTNTATRQHTNTATHQPINLSTLKNTATPLTQQHTRPAAPGNSSFGDAQQHTYSDHPDHGVGLGSAPCAQEPRCYVHGARATWWKRGDDMVCSLCHPAPPGEIQQNSNIGVFDYPDGITRDPHFEPGEDIEFAEWSAR